MFDTQYTETIAGFVAHNHSNEEILEFLLPPAFESCCMYKNSHVGVACPLQMWYQASH
jgi:hypothetical protein